MIRVMIVDDEPHAVHRIARFIEQTDGDFSVVATAINGRQALDKLETTPCDVLFTDIKMPIMGGNDVLRHVNELYPHILKVVISGFDDYAYISEAMRSQTFDYLLKPLVEDEARALLKRLKERHYAALHQRMHAVLANAINKGLPDEATGDENEQAVCAAIYCVGTMPVGDAEFCLGAQFWGENRLQAVLGGEESAQTHWDLTGETLSEKILAALPGAENEALFTELYKRLCGLSNCAVSCVYTLQPIEVSRLGERLRAMRRAMQERLRVGKSLLFCADMPPAKPKYATKWAFAMLDVIFESGDASRVRLLFERFVAEGWTQADIFSAISLAFARHADRIGGLEEYRRVLSAFADSISSALTMAELQEDFSALVAALLHAPEHASAIAGRISEYLRENMAQPITSQTLSKVFGYAPSYISVLFRREYGCSPSEYLLRLRIEAARKMFLEHPEMLVRDVAFRVGFKNQYHFSKTFKKALGIWPSEYRPEN